MKKFSFLTLAALAALSFSPLHAEESQSPAEADYDLVSTNDYEPVKADIIDSTPANFTIDVNKLANLGVDQKADIFTVYTSSSKPDQCADFRKVELSYSKPEKHLRRFDLSGQPQILKAIENQNCVAIPNIPAS